MYFFIIRIKKQLNYFIDKFITYFDRFYPYPSLPDTKFIPFYINKEIFSYVLLIQQDLSL